MNDRELVQQHYRSAIVEVRRRRGMPLYRITSSLITGRRMNVSGECKTIEAAWKSAAGRILAKAK